MAPKFELVTGAPDADLLVVPVFSGGQLGPGAQLVDDALGDALPDFMQEADFDGKRGEVLAVPTGGRVSARAILLLGVGDADTFDLAGLRRAAAVLARRAAKVGTVATTLIDAIGSDVDRGAAAQAFAEGVCLGRYQFLRYKSEGKAS
jgi:leucyl aminopeptidase